MGIAVPHAKLEGYNDFFIAIAIVEEGVDWNALDETPVRVVFMIGGPDNRQNEYLGILQLLTQAIKGRDLREKLAKSPMSPADVIKLFKETEEDGSFS